ncbi:MAG: GNAT family N-acetyltransferase [Chloroflexota bacterium]
MIRPTMQYQIKLDEPFVSSKPDNNELDRYADLLHSAFTGGVGMYGQRERDDYAQSLERLFADTDYLPEASSVVINTENGQVASLCLVTETGGHGCINFVATHPDYQKRGLGRQIILSTLDKLYGTKLWVTLAVTIGNPALTLYERLGFKQGTVISSMQLA